MHLFCYDWKWKKSRYISIGCLNSAALLILFVCWGFSFRSTAFLSLGYVTTPGEGLQIFIYARNSWALSSEGFFCLSHLLWHGTSVYNGHLQGPVTLTPIADRWAVELSLHVLTIYVCRGWDSNTQPSACEANTLTHCAITTGYSIWRLHDHYKS